MEAMFKSTPGLTIITSAFLIASAFQEPVNNVTSGKSVLNTFTSTGISRLSFIENESALFFKNSAQDIPVRPAPNTRIFLFLNCAKPNICTTTLPF